MKKFLGKSLKTIIVFLIIIGFFGSGLFLIWASQLKIPDFDSFNERKVTQSTKIYDRTGEVLLFNLNENLKRTVVSGNEISVNIKNATIAIEDVEFFNHKGVRPLAIIRALFLQPLRGQGVQGGSTITQQVVKNTLLTNERKVSRKLKEMVLAIKLEKLKTKDEILEIYLNESPYGGTIYGVEEASQSFFGKPASDVNLAEAAYLAALPQAPTYYSPYGNNQEDLIDRKNLVLARMAEIGFITDKEARDAMKEVVVFRAPEERGIKAPHFVMYIREQLEQKYGVEKVENGGLTVLTTLDWDLQEKAESIVSEYGASNAERFNANNAGLVATDPKTGQILVMVGSRDYFNNENDGNFNVALSKRQPGSSFKPFVYATAFEKGYTPETVVFDVKTEFSANCDTQPESCYSPVNYDFTYHGPMTFREALARSVNIPAVKALYLSGIRDSLRTARALGISTLTDPDRYGLTLVLGGGEVTLLEMTNAYGALANEGTYNKETGIMKVTDSEGNVLEEFSQNPKQAISVETARKISDVLSDNEARTPSFGANSPLYFPGRDVAAKTGTTNDFRDAWIVGYTPSISIGAWAGNNDNSAMEKRVAGFVIAPLWRAFFEQALVGEPVEYFNPPTPTPDDIKPVLRGIWQGSESYVIDKISGKLATEYTPEAAKKEIIVQDIHSILHWVIKDDPQGLIPLNPSSDSQYELWEEAVSKWVEENNIIEEEVSIPTEFDDIHTPDSLIELKIETPVEGTLFDKNNEIRVSLDYDSRDRVERIDYFLNGILIGSQEDSRSDFVFVPTEFESELRSVNTISVKVYDDKLNSGEDRVTFLLSI